MTVVFPIHIHLHFTKEIHMASADLKTALDAAEAELDKALARSQSVAAAKQAQIDKLTEEVKAAGSDPALIARVDALSTKIDALDPTNPTTLPAVPAPTP